MWWARPPSSLWIRSASPKTLALDPSNRVLRFSDPIRVAVAIRKGEQFEEVSDFTEALKEYQKALEVNHSQLALALPHRGGVLPPEQLPGGGERIPRGAERRPGAEVDRSMGHVNLGKIFDMTGQRERAVNELHAGHAHQRQHPARPGRSGEVPQDALRAEAERD